MKRRRDSKLTAIDLFCGAGGMSVGLKRAGLRILAAVDVDQTACAVYRENHPEVHLWHEDIRKLSVKTVLRRLALKPGQLDLLAACPPCQGFSSLRTKNGRRSNRDDRNLLVLDLLRFVRGLRPRTVMFENVPGLARGRRLARLAAALKHLGYESVSGVLNAADFGVAQRRRRVVLLASRIRRPEFARAIRRRVTVRDAIGGLARPSRSRDSLHNYKSQRSDRIVGVMRAIPKDGGSRSAIGDKAQLACHRRLNGFSDVYGRMAWDVPAPTITSGCTNPSKGRFIHPAQNRAITLREAALLQAFPRRYKFSIHLGREKLALLIGNALPPEFIRRQTLSLLATGLKASKGNVQRR